MATPILEKLAGMMNRAPLDVVGIDCATNAVRLVRVKRTAAGISLVGAGFLDPPNPIVLGMAEEGVEPQDVKSLSIPSALRGKHAGLCVPGVHSLVKVLRVPDRVDVEDREQMMTRLGCEDPDRYRFAVRTVVPSTARTEARILAVAIPEVQAESVLHLAPSSGLPAPASIELSDLAVLNAYSWYAHAEGMGVCGLVHFDHDFSVFALFNKGLLSQVRTFDFGLAKVVKLVMEALSVDEATAEGILQDGAFDMSHLIEEGIREVHGQFVICRDFMERSENCRLETLHLSGSEGLSKPFIDEVHNTVETKPWSVLESLDEGAVDGLPEEWQSEPWRITAAFGCCIGLLEEES